MNTQFTNRRKFNRIQFDESVKLDFATDSYDNCRAKNLSLSGIYIAGEFRKQLSEYCRIHFAQAAAAEEKSFHASARFVRRDDEGIALEFTSMTFDCYAFLMATLIYSAEESLIIEGKMPDNCPFKILDA